MQKCRTIAILVLALSSHLSAQNAKNSIAVSFPGAGWMVLIERDDFKVQKNETDDRGRRYLLADSDKTKVTLSVTLERVRGMATLADCTSTLNKRVQNPGPLKPSSVKTSSSKDFAILEYVLHEVGGVPVEQKNVFACAAKGDTYVDLHFSKALYTPKDDELFAGLLQSVYLVDGAATGANSSGSSSLDLWLKGGALFADGDFAKAIEPYQKALDLEKKTRQLSPAYWKVLIDNLGMAYGITGKLSEAEEVFRYGLSLEAEYPLFHYNLACVYAERNDLDNAMKYLTAAFQYRKNVIVGEKMPDPKSDDSFQRFMKDPKFRKLVESF
jgi:hypothetical protein